jgi:hypothetical protein
MWYLRLADTHSVVNRGTSDRVHLVIDAEPNAWMAELFTRAMTNAKPDVPTPGNSCYPGLVERARTAGP